MKFFKFVLLIGGLSFMSFNAEAFDLSLIKSAATGVTSMAGFSSNESQETTDDSSQADKVKGNYLTATKCYLDSIALAQEAFGLKKEAEITKAEASQLNCGTLSKSDLEKHTATLENAQRVISEKINQGVTLNKAGKDKLKQSMILMAKGVATDTLLTAEVAIAAKSISSSLASNPLGSALAMKSMLPVLTMMGKELPKNISTSKNILSLYIDYSRANGIEVPKDASSLFS